MTQTRVDRVTLLGLLAGTLGVSTAFGMLLLLPLYVKADLGGDEADFGLVSAAGTITAALAIGALIKYPRRRPPHQVLGLASLAYGATAFGVSLTHAVSWPLIVLGVVLGTAWAVAYTTAPMVISELCDDVSRAKYIGYVTGMIQVGFGLGPVTGHLLADLGMSYPGVFRTAAALSVLAGVIVLPLHRRTAELAPRAQRRAEGSPLGPALLGILRSRAAVPLLMILLAACLFTTMNSFQTTYADSQGLAFDIFYISYTISVIFARFVLARAFRNPSSPQVLAGASLGIVASIGMFLVVNGDPVLYGLASVLLGVTYGLTLPAVQANAVNLSAERYRPRMLPLAGLVFEVAILGFPLVAGTIITASDYSVLFVVLLGFAVAVAALGIGEAVYDRRTSAGRRALPVSPSRSVGT